MLKSLLITVILTSTSIAMAIEAPVISPALPSAGQPVNVMVTTGPCDALAFNSQGVAYQVDTQDRRIEMNLVLAGLEPILVCNVPVVTDQIPIGALEEGEYILATYGVPFDLTFPVDPSERIFLFETSFSVGPAATAVPTMRAPGMYLLTLLLAGFGLLWLRRGQNIQRRDI